MWLEKNRKTIIWVFAFLAILSLAALPYIKFSFDFERFFPNGDPDLDFYKEFVQEFESDDNYLLIAFTHETSVLDTHFLKKIKTYTEEAPALEEVISALSLPTLQKPVFGPFGISFKNILNINSPDLKLQYEKIALKKNVMKGLISNNHKSTVVALKIKEHLDIDASRSLIEGVTALILKNNMGNYHILGRAYFQHELARLQVEEVLFTSLVSIVLVSIILFLLYRNIYLVFITLCSITLALLLFMGLLSVLGREMDAMSALYPVLMLIVGTSDVIHILSKYLDEIRQGKKISTALETTIKQIGLATLFTSATTAIGFLSLITSRIGPVRDFGINAAIGVVVAYITIIFFTTALLTYLSPKKLKTHAKTFKMWDNVALWFYRISKHHLSIFYIAILSLTFCAYGISKVTTDYKTESSLPLGKKVTEDFQFFEKNYSGYRSVEYVLIKKEGSEILDLDGIKTVDLISKKINTHESIENVTSISTVVASVSDYLPTVFTQSTEWIDVSMVPFYKAAISAMPIVLINKNEDKTRISTQIKDIGAYKIKLFTNDVAKWATHHIDTTTYALLYTGTGLIIDKNALYVREGLLKGLAFALLIIGVLMGFLFKSMKMVLISFVPNVIPLFIVGAILGYTGIPLEPVTSIIFVVVFGIAVDDTIHFLSKYRLALHSSMSIEESIKVSFQESGKAILFTTTVLFFGFMVMLFSYNPASVIVGGLISITLFTAVFADLIILPMLLRVFNVRT